MNGFAAESFLEQIFLASFGSDFEFQRKEPVSLTTRTVTIDHDSADEGELTTRTHPLVVEDVLEELEQDVVHFENERGLFALGFGDLVDMGYQEMLDAVHLMVLISIAELSAALVFAGSSVRPDSSSAG